MKKGKFFSKVLVVIMVLAIAVLAACGGLSAKQISGDWSDGSQTYSFSEDGTGKIITKVLTLTNETPFKWSLEENKLKLIYEGQIFNFTSENTVLVDVVKDKESGDTVMTWKDVQPDDEGNHKTLHTFTKVK